LRYKYCGVKNWPLQGISLEFRVQASMLRQAGQLSWHD
jgi:hypothetical protein